MLGTCTPNSASYPAQLPLLAPLRDIPAFLARPQTRLTDGEAAALAAAYARLTARLDHGRGQSLHGDAGPGNLMATAAGWVWHDFEDTCTGPVGLGPGRVRGQPAPRRPAASWPPTPGPRARRLDDEALAPWIALRDLHMTVWYCLYAERQPELRPRAEELLARWRAAQPTSN